MKGRQIAFAALALMLVACSGEAKSGWDDIDYTRLARQAQGRENDPNYTPPITVLGCSDDDLYNCNTSNY